MFALKHHILLGLLMALVLVTPAQAGEAEDLRQYVDENTQRLVEKLNEERGLYEEDPEAFYESMDQALTDFVDFRRIAARLMAATPARPRPNSGTNSWSSSSAACLTVMRRLW